MIFIFMLYRIKFEISQHLQTMDEEKAKLDAFCEQSLKEVHQVLILIIYLFFISNTVISDVIHSLF